MKKNYLFKYILYICLSLSVFNSYSQTAKQVVKGMGSGFNLGNVFDNGQKSTNFNNFKPIIDTYVAAGMTHIRIPTTEIILADGTVSYAFTVDKSIAESAAPDRFKILFGKTLGNVDDEIWAVALYPNPSKTNSFNLFVPLGMDDLQVVVHNMKGQKLYSEKGLKSGSVVKITPSKVLSPGIYFVSLT